MQEITIEKIQNPYGNHLKTLEVGLFYRDNLRQLCETYGYSEGEYELYLSYHQPRELVEKIIDPNRFFRIIRNNEGKIIGFFESRSVDSTEVVQWIFVSESEQKQGISKILWNEFFDYCDAQGVNSVKSYAKLSNSISCQMHEKLGFSKTSEINGDVIYILNLASSKE